MLIGASHAYTFECGGDAPPGIGFRAVWYEYGGDAPLGIGMRAVCDLERKQDGRGLFKMQVILVHYFSLTL